MILFKSIIVGIFAIIPGVSGSTMAIVFNLYDRFFLSINDIRNNKFFLLCFFIGIIIGLYIGSNIIIYFIDSKIMYYLLIGLIISDVPFIIKKVKKNGKLLYIPLFLSFLLSFFTNLYAINIFSNSFVNLKMFIGGILFSFGKIFPGISSSCFLIALDIYSEVLMIFSNPKVLIEHFNFYFPFIIGSILGIIVFTRLLNYMITKKYSLLYSMILGFIISSIFLIIPEFDYFGILFMIISFLISVKIKMRST